MYIFFPYIKKDEGSYDSEYKTVTLYNFNDDSIFLSTFLEQGNESNM